MFMFIISYGSGEPTTRLNDLNVVLFDLTTSFIIVHSDGTLAKSLDELPLEVNIS